MKHKFIKKTRAKLDRRVTNKSKTCLLLVAFPISMSIQKYSDRSSMQKYNYKKAKL